MTPERLRDMIRRRQENPVQEAGSFIRAFWNPHPNDAERRAALEQIYQRTPLGVSMGIDAIKRVLTDPELKGEILTLAYDYGDVDLDEPMDENARRWLQHIVDFTQPIME